MNKTEQRIFTGKQADEALEFLGTIARMKTEEETVGGFTLEDACATLNELIESARLFTDIDPQHPDVYCTLCGADSDGCGCCAPDDEDTNTGENKQ